MGKAAEAYIESFLITVQQSWETHQSLRREVNRLVDKAEQAARRLSEKLEIVAGFYFDPLVRKAVLYQVYLRCIETTEASARVVPGFDLLPPHQQTDAISVAVATIVGSYSIVRPFLDNALSNCL